MVSLTVFLTVAATSLLPHQVLADRGNPFIAAAANAVATVELAASDVAERINSLVAPVPAAATSLTTLAPSPPPQQGGRGEFFTALWRTTKQWYFSFVSAFAELAEPR